MSDAVVLHLHVEDVNSSVVQLPVSFLPMTDGLHQAIFLLLGRKGVAALKLGLFQGAVFITSPAGNLVNLSVVSPATSTASQDTPPIVAPITDDTVLAPLQRSSPIADLSPRTGGGHDLLASGDDLKRLSSDQLCFFFACDVICSVLSPLPGQAIDKSLMIRPRQLNLAAENLALEKMVANSPLPVPYCKGYKLWLIPIATNEVPDGDRQTHVWKIDAPILPGTPCPRSRNFTLPLFNRLAKPARQAYMDKIEAHVKKNFLVPCTASEAADTGLPIASTFLVGFDSPRDSRIVYDIRLLNGMLPSATSRVADIFFSFVSLRIRSPTCITVSDAATAFLRLRWRSMKVPISTACGFMLSDRVLFGFDSGPGLLQSVTEAMASSFCWQPSTRMSIFVDDINCSGPPSSIADAFGFISLMARTGLDCAQHKTGVFVVNDCTNAAIEELNRLGLPSELLKNEITTLGVKISGSHTLTFDCSRYSRESPMRVVAAAILDDDAPFTPRTMFAIAGKIGFDALRMHPAQRSIADGLRSAIGSLMKKPRFEGEKSVSWDTQLCLSTTPSSARRRALHTLLSWFLEIPLSEKCCHESLRPGSSFRLEVVSDASICGYGYTISAVTDAEVSMVLERSAVLFPKSHSCYHSNRKELIGALRATSAAAKLLESDPGLLPTEFRLLCDNKSAVSWLRDLSSSESMIPSTKMIERRAIERLLNAAKEELSIISAKCGGKISISHLPGIANEASDELSRYFLRRCTPLDPNDQPLTLADALYSCGEVDNIDQLAFLFDFLGDDCHESVLSHFTDSAYPLEELHPHYSLPPQDSVLAVGEGQDRLPQLRVARTPSIRIRNRPCIVEEVALTSENNFERLVRSMSFIVDIFRAWRAISRPLPETPASGWFACVASAQSSAFIDQRHICDDGVFRLRSFSPVGDIISLPIIPDSCPQLVKTLIADAHRRASHGGEDQTFARMSIHSPRLRSKVSAFCRSCEVCQRIKARPGWSSAPQSSTDWPSLMRKPCYFYASCDVLVINRWKCLVLVCQATTHTSIRLLKQERMEPIMQLLKELQVELGGLRRIRVDRATYFTSPTFRSLALRDLGAEIEVTFAPIELPILGRMQSLALNIMRRLVLEDGEPRDDASKTLFLKHVEFLLNSRPLVRTSLLDEASRKMTSPLTPDLLAFGRTRRIPALDGEILSSPAVDRIRKARSIFLDLYLRGIKKLRNFADRVNRSLQDKSWTPRSGETVIWWRPRGSKIKTRTTLATVIYVSNRRAVVTLLNDQQLHSVSLVHLVPFDFREGGVSAAAE